MSCHQKHSEQETSQSKKLHPIFYAHIYVHAPQSMARKMLDYVRNGYFFISFYNIPFPRDKNKKNSNEYINLIYFF